MASDARLLGLAEGWLARVNHMSLEELSKHMIHGEVESLATLLREVRDHAQGRDARLLEEALERGRETLHKAIQDRADMQARLANMTKERDDARQLADDIDTLVWSCSKGIHDSTQWEREYRAEWQAVWQRWNW